MKFDIVPTGGVEMILANGWSYRGSWIDVMKLIG
jgi:hypothetical protein